MFVDVIICIEMYFEDVLFSKANAPQAAVSTDLETQTTRDS